MGFKLEEGSCICAGVVSPVWAAMGGAGTVPGLARGDLIKAVDAQEVNPKTIKGKLQDGFLGSKLTMKVQKVGGNKKELDVAWRRLDSEMATELVSVGEAMEALKVALKSAQMPSGKGGLESKLDEVERRLLALARMWGRIEEELSAAGSVRRRHLEALEATVLARLGGDKSLLEKIRAVWPAEETGVEGARARAAAAEEKQAALEAEVRARGRGLRVQLCCGWWQRG
jgi:hypothetical protein